MAMVIWTSDDFYPDAGATKLDYLSLGRDRRANSHRADEAKREHDLSYCSHDTFPYFLRTSIGEGVCINLENVIKRKFPAGSLYKIEHKTEEYKATAEALIAAG
jgi:hypothetical protein